MHTRRSALATATRLRMPAKLPARAVSARLMPLLVSSIACGVVGLCGGRLARTTLRGAVIKRQGLAPLARQQPVCSILQTDTMAQGAVAREAALHCATSAAMAAGLAAARPPGELRTVAPARAGRAGYCCAACLRDERLLPPRRRLSPARRRRPPLGRPPGWELACGTLLTLTLLGVAFEVKLGAELARLFPSARVAPSCGLATGLLAVPWALAGLLLQGLASGGGGLPSPGEAAAAAAAAGSADVPAAAALSMALAGGLAASALCGLLVLQRLAAEVARQGGPPLAAAVTAAAAHPPAGDEAARVQQSRQGALQLLLAARGGLAGLAVRLALDSYSPAATLLTAACAAWGLHVLLNHLPHALTVGEAAVVAEGGAHAAQQVGHGGVVAGKSARHNVAVHHHVPAVVGMV